MDSGHFTPMPSPGTPLQEAGGGHRNGLQVVPDAGTNECWAYRRCYLCRREKPISNFYRKREGFETRCKECILRVKARAYKRKRKAQREVVWHEVFETTAEERSNVQLEDLLREFMLEVILDAS